MMNPRYIPQIREAVIPEDGGWAELGEADRPVLVLSVPEWADELKQSEEGFEYVWLYDRSNDAYLFCFRLDKNREYSIAFAREHAGLLLKDKRSCEAFHLLVTARPLTEQDLNPCFLFRNVELKRHPQAGW